MLTKAFTNLCSVVSRTAQKGLNPALKHLSLSVQSNPVRIRVPCVLPLRQLHVSRCCAASRWGEDDPLGDPLHDLGPYLQAPLLTDQDMVFKPSRDEVQEAQELFKISRQNPNAIDVVRGVVNLEHLPDHQLPEIAFAGRSNVGKSTLINALFFENKNLRIAISKKPGHTRTLNFYNVKKKFSLVDMPGYGYNMPCYYSTSMEEYLKTRRQICRIFLLIDGQVGLTETDRTGIEMLEECVKPYTIILTKIDKASHHKVLKNIMSLQKERETSLTMDGSLSQPFLVSPWMNAGVAYLRSFIAYATGNLHVEGL